MKVPFPAPDPQITAKLVWGAEGCNGSVVLWFNYWRHQKLQHAPCVFSISHHKPLKNEPFFHEWRCLFTENVQKTSKFSLKHPVQLLSQGNVEWTFPRCSLKHDADLLEEAIALPIQSTITQLSTLLTNKLFWFWKITKKPPKNPQ